MSTVARQRVTIAAGLRTFLRKPMNAVLLLVMPPLVLFAYDLALDPIAEAPGIEVPPGGAALGGALFATAFLAGLLGVFQIVGALAPDRRLIVCGYRPSEVLLARLLSILTAGILVAVISFLTFRYQTDITPEAPVLAVGALIAAASVYGLIGVIVGGLLRRELEGSLVLVFLADLDAFTAIDAIPTESPLLDYLPLAVPHELLSDAVYEGSVATDDVLAVVGYVAVLSVLALTVAVVGDSP